MFRQLRANRRFADYLQRKLDEQVKILVVNPNVDTVRVAQGKAQAFQGLLDRLRDSR